MLTKILKHHANPKSVQQIVQIGISKAQKKESRVFVRYQTSQTAIENL